VWRPTGDVLAVEQHIAGAWPHEPHDRAPGGSLADAIAAEHCEDRAVVQFEIDALQHMAGAVMGIERVYRQHQTNPPR
jgi:hypothetical protein